ncbi:MAG: hypothetical protein COU07_00560 [Candidatus Harrisonbacteria bacterium CG10_big_fil_rev_8_21_14_0_10_40_38]|uniref:Peptidase S11 D-alanyl-D-alanine carboxypeptidase A N-terminal domain-containing protein n=1 Tax=Candidatus Harrisonbacteria bacterium CG10_big_fil_rev_8_21_14_0_10_40_38 TaxID=1974583 RepID=A0A2H0USL6_9BACT|nr:MAG: hypothetical protein COU07_00560 [Candidatus Harrisonbacteria bacterium CG10_big_fil_rev_8_21_14_0_10_40_38]
MKLSRFHLQSLAFVLVVFLLVAFGPVGSNGDSRRVDPDGRGVVSQTSLTINTALQTPSPVYITPEPVLSLLPPKNYELSAGARVLAFAKPQPILPSNLPPIFHGKSAIVKELNHGIVLFEQSPEQHWPLASLTKLMTTLVSLEIFQPEKQVTITSEMIVAYGEAGGFSTGEIFSVKDLIKASLLISSNDAASALALSSDGESFINDMNLRAKELLMNETSFADPTGLSVLNQSTVRDMTKLVQTILSEYPELFEYTTNKSVSINEIVSGAQRTIPSNNEFVGQPDFVGGKTGYTDDANGNLISLFREGDNLFLIIVFGTDDRFGETRALYNWASEIY